MHGLRRTGWFARVRAPKVGEFNGMDRKGDREERMKKALRANLQRRKQKHRELARSGATEPSASPVNEGSAPASESGETGET